MLPTFDRSRLIVKPLAERQHDLSIDQQLGLEELPPPLEAPAMASIEEVGRRMAAARDRGAAILLLMGAHVIRAGVARQLIDLMERGLVTHIGMNGAGPIHDYELARIGATCESVARYIRTGEFGLWRETGELNDVVRHGALRGQGLGQAIGRHILDSDYPHKDLSVLAAGVRLNVPVTVHVGIGYDILHEHPNFEPAAFGMASYRDFLTVCHTVDKLEGGVFLCMGSAVMGPEVYLKALSMARNVAHQEGRQIAHFTTAAFDLIPIEGDWQAEAPKTNPQYYYRPWKTVLVRTVADGGESFYVCGDHRQTVPHLRQAAVREAALGKPKSPAPAPPVPARPVPPVPAPSVPEPKVQAARGPGAPSPAPPAVRKTSRSVSAPKQSGSESTSPAGGAAAAKSSTPTLRIARAEDLDGAASHYLQIKQWVQSNDAHGLAAHQVSEHPNSHYSKISKEDYLRLFFRTVWTSGAKSQIVLTREDEYFQVVHEELYPGGRFDPRRELAFLSKVASVLGGSRENRKNKAMFHTINLVESLGWEEFRRRYVAPQTRLTARLQELPMVGPKTVKMLLEQTGSGEVDAEGWVERFARHYGFADADKCIEGIAARTGDSPMMIDFVLGSAGRQEAFTLAG